MKTFASRYRLERSLNANGRVRWKVRDVVTGKLLSSTAIFGKRSHAIWPLQAKRQLEAKAAGLTERDLLDVHFRVMTPAELRKARGQRPLPRRRHSRDSSVRCDICSPLRCEKAP